MGLTLFWLDYIVHCNDKEIISNYSEITECKLPLSLPNVGITFKLFAWNFEKQVIFKLC